VEYKFYTEFQSHEAEFDFLKSVEIEEKINQICWCRGSNGALFLLSTNGAWGWAGWWAGWWAG
jgi:serine/threonine-protein phosphatase 2A regulatory subunit B